MIFTIKFEFFRSILRFLFRLSQGFRIWHSQPLVAAYIHGDEVGPYGVCWHSEKVALRGALVTSNRWQQRFVLQSG